MAVEPIEPTAEHDPTVIHGCDTDEHASRTVYQLLARDGGILNRMPCGFEQQPLLRIHGDRFARGDREEARIESGDVRQQSGLAAAWLVAAIDGRRLGPSIGRDRTYTVASGEQRLPE